MHKLLYCGYYIPIKKKEKNRQETFLSPKSWIFTIAIIWGRILQNWEKRQSILTDNFITISLSYGFHLLICSVLD
jgi:hypothetical protein